MTDKKKPAAKTPATNEGKATKPKSGTAKPKSAKPAAKPAKAKKPVKARSTPQKRSLTPVAPEPSPPTDQMVLDALADGLTMKEIAFIETYLTCYNATKAWMEVYPTNKPRTAQSSASDCLSKPKIRAYLAKRAKAAFDRTEEAQDRLIQLYIMQAYGDANELVEFRREACRYCYGTDHKYQRTPNEMRRAREQYDREVKSEKAKAAKDGQGVEFEPFDEEGGEGFDPRLPPHEDCPECFGQGIGREFFKDTRNLSPAAQALYAGVKVSKEGLEIKTVSREKAQEMLAKLLKLTDDTSNFNFNFDADELQTKFADKMAAAHERMAKIREARGLDREGG